MTVFFVGAGPGAADLVTVRALRLLEKASVVVYAGALVPTELLASCPPGARLVDSASLDLDQILAVLSESHDAGRDVVRLHSGDPSVFSAVAEQARRLDALGIPWEVVPGVPAFAAAAAALKRELTAPSVAQTVILSRISVDATPMPEGEDLASLARSRSTLVLHLAVQHIERVVEELTPSYGLDCPVAVVARASRPDEVILRGTLGDIEAQVRSAKVKRTAVIVVGRVLAAEGFPDSHLYSTERGR
ncbi:MAG: Precorrin-4 C11-methyltransferase [Frankiales bacterium]|nr:Precorrin-4 C11-methyltransferase [Frankiales bacterium]